MINTLHAENCLATMARMPNDLVDLTVTSPPYDDIRDYDGFTLKDFTQIAHELYRITKQGGVLVWIIGDQTKDGNESGTSFKQALHFKEIGFNLFDTMIYAKEPRGAVGTSTRQYFQCFEYMFVFSKGMPNTTNLIRDRKNKHDNKQTIRYRKPNGEMVVIQKGDISQPYSKRSNIWEYSIGYRKSAENTIAHEHPAIFPEKLAEDHILSWSNTGNLVYDPFTGSGTTALMARKHGRKYIGSEINKKYCEIAHQRLAQTQLF